MQYPHVCQFIQIMMATPPNTSPVERGYSSLQMVATKRRNALHPTNLETLFLLAALKKNMPVKKPDCYVREVNRIGR